MPKRYSTRDVERVLLAFGFLLVSQRGSHKKYTRGEYVVIVPAGRKEIRPGTFASILRQSGLNASNFDA
jgi:predicted RNA binding protein YcfA (HicA-like mRNA interferase family)